MPPFKSYYWSAYFLIYNHISPKQINMLDVIFLFELFTSFTCLPLMGAQCLQQLYNSLQMCQGFSFPLAPRINGQTPLGFIGRCPGNHLDAVYDWTDAEAQGAARTAICYNRQVGLWVKLNSLEVQKAKLITGLKKQKMKPITQERDHYLDLTNTLTDIQTWYPESLHVM